MILTKWTLIKKSVYLKDLANGLKSDNNPKPFWYYIYPKRMGTNKLELL